MVDTVAVQTRGMLARLKVSPTADARMAINPTSAERRLDDLVTLSSAAKTKLQDARKLDAYLRFYQSALKIINGSFSRFVPWMSKVEVEYVAPATKNSVKTDA